MSTIPLIADLYGTLALIPLEGKGILDWITTKNTQTQLVVRSVAVTIAIIFVVINAISSRFAIARIIIAGLAAGLFVWIVWNITDVRDKIGNEMTGYISFLPAQIAPPPHAPIPPDAAVTPPVPPDSPSWA